MVYAMSDVGTKYAQTVNSNTPEYASGGVRMEDSWSVRRLRSGLVICVADGHGSTKLSEGVYVGGRECADTACNSVASSNSTNPNELFVECQNSIRSTLNIPGQYWKGNSMHVRTERGEEVPMHGCTLSVCKLTELDSWFAWTGDSVGVAIISGETVPLGVPHGTKNTEEVRRMRQMNATVDGNYFEYRTSGSKVRISVSRSLGHFGHAPMSQTPEITHFNPKDGDRILIATDGLWDMITQEKAGSILSNASSEKEACTQLIEHATSTSRKPRDNVVVVVHFVMYEKRDAAGCCAVS